MLQNLWCLGSNKKLLTLFNNWGAEAQCPASFLLAHTQKSCFIPYLFHTLQKRQGFNFSSSRAWWKAKWSLSIDFRGLCLRGLLHSLFLFKDLRCVLKHIGGWWLLVWFCGHCQINLFVNPLRKKIARKKSAGIGQCLPQLGLEG